MPKRRFEDISVAATGVHSFSDRFGKRRRYGDGTPPIAQWRCNLTALSQVHNLYFVAYDQDIHVYVPQFPSQAITEKPALVFSSQPSSDGLRGYLDARHPHAINSLIVQHLGNEEVVAVVRDDGDVDAFLVRHVVQAVERRAEKGSTIGVTADEIRPFFQDNVEMSAWGLAIHSEARILATSSNKHEVRIFKFGLISEDDQFPDEELPDADQAVPPDLDGEGEQSRQKRKSRKQDVQLRVINGNANIPYISFCNTGDDPEARWLLTTDIGGFCRVMDLHESVSSQTFRFGQSFVGANTGGFDRLNAGWTIMFLDKRSFNSQPDFDTALGLSEDETLPKLKDDAKVWDLSKTARRLSGASTPFIHRRIPKRDSPEHPPDARSPSGQSLGSDTTESMNASVQPSDSSDASQTLEIEIDVDRNESDDDDDNGGVDIGIEHTIAEDDRNEEGDDDVMTIAPWSDEDEAAGSDGYIGIVDSDDDPDDEGTEDSTPFSAFYNGDSICGHAPRFARVEAHSGSLANDLPCPILHASVRNIYLLQPSNQQSNPGPWTPPMMGFANPLSQPVQQNYEYLRMFERLNMSAYIPALGVVVLASQKGRAIVLALTSIPKTAKHPAEIREAPSMSTGKKTTYAMRIQCILPFAKQEGENARPFAPLHGLAAGPMQGFEGEGKGKGKRAARWRLMLMYQDHSILSYDIFRGAGRSKGGEVGLDVERVVV